eukprot:384930_1
MSILQLCCYIILFHKSHGTINWNYHAQYEQYWDQNFADCDNNDESPIHIVSNNSIISAKKCGPEFDWQINETHNTFCITNNGHTISLSPINTNNPIAHYPNYFHYEQLTTLRRYCLDSFHFHWGLTNNVGSEHTIDTETFPLEAHFVHYSCDYNNISHALKAYVSLQDTHVISVVSLLFKFNDSTNNIALNSILSDDVLNAIELPNTTIIYDLLLHKLIPNNIDTAGYYYYEGSLTTPPCTDVVRWNVMNAYQYINNEQLNRFREFMFSTNGTIAPNYRNTQFNKDDLFGCFTRNENKKECVEKKSETVNIILFVLCAVFLVVAIMFGLMYCKTNKLLKEMNGNLNEPYKKLTEME